MKKLIVFDLDGTLAESKQAIDEEMAHLIADLLDILSVAVISGGDWSQFEKQVLDHLPANARTSNLSILPTSGTKFYRFTGQWAQVYAEDFSESERSTVLQSLDEAVSEAGLLETRIWGDQIEDRGTQITFSGLGQKAPPAEKAKWDYDHVKRNTLKALLDKKLNNFAVRIGGSTSIDITRPGVDKALGMRRLAEQTGIETGDMLFIGDALYPGGNDAPMRDAGISSIWVNDVAQTKLVIETLVKSNGGQVSLATTN
ncbi:hypothetical protein AEAC466_14375 [Asticcacaulis sp. AC466]|uniref:HAD-IIB family hydrolase n=1 Tax=Asticcacaulis sp. AC466 TaxID=1282362 RepID=UPI0003C3DB81|nr:HAD-IIB family hydrolase [Asticcacaulis sp. AC466]ESQ83045.1 hypothetical protein AEAC466_14375 [Asticcacaulis sp. AC466]